MRNPFRRKKNQTIAELESYYASQRGGKRTGVAWVMAIISLLITIIVIALLYFGVRWIYRVTTNEDTEIVTTTQDQASNSGQSSLDTDGSTPDTDTGVDAENRTDILTDLLGGNSGPSESEGTVTDEAASTTREVASESTSASSNATPATGGNELPNTGAGDSLVILLTTVVVFGYLAARKRQLG